MSKLEVDAIEPQSGTTLTIGANGDAVNIASGATITDFTSTGIDDNATSTAITIDSSERVGIGTASPSSLLELNASSGDLIQKLNGATATFSIRNQSDGSFGHYDHTNSRWLDLRTYSTDTYALFTAGSERMRIDSVGRILINTTSHIGNSPYLNIANTYTNSGMAIKSNTALAHHAIEFHNTNGQVGFINTSGTSTVYSTSSDYRLKENVVEMTNATDRLKQLQPKRFNFIADEDTTVDGFLAHEVSNIVPEAISGEKDATKTKEKVVVDSNGNVIAENIEQADWETGKIADENGNTKYPTDSTWEATKVVPVYQGIDQSKLVPLLVKTIQELEARITALENA
jgi:hypothetical protein